MAVLPILGGLAALGGLGALLGGKPSSKGKRIREPDASAFSMPSGPSGTDTGWGYAGEQGAQRAGAPANPWIGETRTQAQGARSYQEGLLGQLGDTPNIARRAYEDAQQRAQAGVQSQLASLPGMNPAAVRQAQVQQAGMAQQMAGDSARAQAEEQRASLMAQAGLTNQMRAQDQAQFKAEAQLLKDERAQAMALENLRLAYQQMGMTDKMAQAAANQALEQLRLKHGMAQAGLDQQADAAANQWWQNLGQGLLGGGMGLASLGFKAGGGGGSTPAHDAGHSMGQGDSYDD